MKNNKEEKNEKKALPFDEIELGEKEMLVVKGGTGMSYEKYIQEAGSGSGCGCGCGCGC